MGLVSELELVIGVSPLTCGFCFCSVGGSVLMARLEDRSCSVREGREGPEGGCRDDDDGGGERVRVGFVVPLRTGERDLERERRCFRGGERERERERRRGRSDLEEGCSGFDLVLSWGFDSVARDGLYLSRLGLRLLLLLRALSWSWFCARRVRRRSSSRSFSFVRSAFRSLSEVSRLRPRSRRLLSPRREPFASGKASMALRLRGIGDGVRRSLAGV